MLVSCTDDTTDVPTTVDVSIEHNPSVIVAGNGVEFTALHGETAQGYKYVWNFDSRDNDISVQNSNTITHSFADAGNYRIEVEVYDIASGELRGKGSIVINIHDRHDAFFVTYSPDNPHIIEQVQFTAILPSNLVDERLYRWDFGDGSDTKSIVNDSTVSYTYKQQGVYTVTCSMIDDASGKTVHASTRQIEIRGYSVTLDAAPQSATAYDEIEFAVHTVGDAPDGYTYEWDFGDGTTVSSTDSSMTHVYTSEGTYTAKVSLLSSVGDTLGSAMVTVDVDALTFPRNANAFRIIYTVTYQNRHVEYDKETGDTLSVGFSDIKEGPIVFDGASASFQLQRTNRHLVFTRYDTNSASQWRTRSCEFVFSADGSSLLRAMYEEEYSYYPVPWIKAVYEVELQIRDIPIKGVVYPDSVTYIMKGQIVQRNTMTWKRTLTHHWYDKNDYSKYMHSRVEYVAYNQYIPEIMELKVQLFRQ